MLSINLSDKGANYAMRRRKYALHDGRGQRIVQRLGLYARQVHGKLCEGALHPTGMI